MTDSKNHSKSGIALSNASLYRRYFDHSGSLLLTRLVVLQIERFFCIITKFLLSCYYMEELNIQVQTAGINKVRNTVF